MLAFFSGLCPTGQKGRYRRGVEEAETPLAYRQQTALGFLHPSPKKRYLVATYHLQTHY